MSFEQLHFIQNETIERFKPTPPDQLGKWGKMNAHQTVEHLADFFKVSSAQYIFPLVTPEEQLPAYKAFLLSDKMFRENTKAPVTVLGEEPLPVRTRSMEEAISNLDQSIQDFIEYFKADPSITTVHPVFGPLNFDEWVQLHYKHVHHHLRQFELV